MSAPQLTLTVRHTASALDTRRGVVRLHREVLDALGLRAWDAVRLTGARVSVALAAPAPAGAAPGVLLADDVTMGNVGVAEGADVLVRPCEVRAARRVTVSGSRLARLSVPEHTLRLALIGKVLTVGDAVSLLPQDLAPPPGSDVPAVRGTLSRAVGATWTSELLTVTATEPDGAVAVGRATVVTWREPHTPAPDGPATRPGDTATTAATTTAPTGAAGSPAGSADPGEAEHAEDAGNAVPLADLAGAESAARRLGEWFELAFDRPDLLATLGTSRRLGVLVSGPEGVGKATLVRSVAHARRVPVVEVEAPGLAALEPDAAASRFTAAVERAAATGGTAAVERAAAPGETASGAGTPAVLLVTDVDALLPATTPPPVATVLVDRIRDALGRSGVAVVATTAHPESVDPRLRSTDLLDRELRLGLPDARTRTELLRILLRDTPVEHGADLGRVAERTPGFVAADLVALRRE
ncbi:AAA family ATPase, partial [Saccharomonospora iraqiensis]|uniref:AAA family ATPase n=1 Tax=Saccharomonospora iraqiensis TaxID=52698 RepID=UPI00022E0EBE